MYILKFYSVTLFFLKRNISVTTLPSMCLFLLNSKSTSTKGDNDNVHGSKDVLSFQRLPPQENNRALSPKVNYIILPVRDKCIEEGGNWWEKTVFYHYIYW